MNIIYTQKQTLNPTFSKTYNETNFCQISGPVYPENCNCPEPSPKKWLDYTECPKSFKQIKNDLALFKDVDLEHASKETIRRYNISTAHSLSRYKIINNQVNTISINSILQMHFERLMYDHI